MSTEEQAADHLSLVEAECVEGVVSMDDCESAARSMKVKRGERDACAE